MTEDINIREVIKERYATLPEELKAAVTAADLPDKMKSIADKHGLLLDQAGVLQNEIIFVMMGMESSSAFMKNISEELRLDKDKLYAIAQDVNSIIFDPIRTHLRQTEEGDAPEHAGQEEAQTIIDKTVSSVEQAGNFSIEKNINQDNDIGDTNSVTPADKARILNDIENPKATVERVTSNTPRETHTEPLVDQLLNGPTATVEEKKTVQAPTENGMSTPPKPKMPDLYREPVK